MTIAIRDTQVLREGLRIAIDIIDKSETPHEMTVQEAIRLKDKLVAISTIVIRAVRGNTESRPIEPIAQSNTASKWSEDAEL